MSVKMLLAFGLATCVCSVANAQNMNLGRGQMVYISPNGQISMMSVPTDAKSVRSMHRGMRGMSHGVIVWMDDAGQMHLLQSYIESTRHTP
jgi:hypothetical protein